MKEAIWLEDLRREARWDAVISARPSCSSCGELIPFGRCMKLDDGSALCERCVEDRMLEAELWGEE